MNRNLSPADSDVDPLDAHSQAARDRVKASKKRAMARTSAVTRVANGARSTPLARSADCAACAIARPGIGNVAAAVRRRGAARLVSTVSESEMSFFGGLADRGEWWRETGELGLLHRMNEARVGFLRDRRRQDDADPVGARASTPVAVDVEGPAFLDGLTALDVGCGGGIFSEVRWMRFLVDCKVCATPDPAHGLLRILLTRCRSCRDSARRRPRSTPARPTSRPQQRTPSRIPAPRSATGRRRPKTSPTRVRSSTSSARWRFSSTSSSRGSSWMRSHA